MTTSKIRVFARFGAFSVLALAATALASAPASAATNCQLPEAVPYSLTHTLTALEQAKHDAAIVGCQQRQLTTQQSFSVAQDRTDPLTTTRSIARKAR